MDTLTLIYEGLGLLIIFLVIRQISPRNVQSMSNVAKISKAAVAALVYFFIAATSVMSTDSCGAGSSCSLLETLLSVGYLWLLVSFIFGVVYPLYSQKAAENKWLRVFYPYSAIPIFIAMVAIGMSAF